MTPTMPEDPITKSRRFTGKLLLSAILLKIYSKNWLTLNLGIQVQIRAVHVGLSLQTHRRMCPQVSDMSLPSLPLSKLSSSELCPAQYYHDLNFCFPFLTTPTSCLCFSWLRTTVKQLKLRVKWLNSCGETWWAITVQESGLIILQLLCTGEKKYCKT